MVLAEQITTISKDALRTYLGAVGEGEKMSEIDNAVKTQLALLTAQSGIMMKGEMASHE